MALSLRASSPLLLSISRQPTQTMVSKRFMTQALCALSTLSSAIAYPAANVAERSASRFEVGRPSLLRRGHVVAPVSRGFRSRQTTYSKEDTVPGSRLWEFEELKELVESGQDQDKKIVIVDVREPNELFDTGKIPGAINIPITSAVQSFHIPEDDFADMYGYDRPPKDAELLFYCKAGVRARAAAALAQQAGWERVGEYPGSWLDWAAKKGPVEKVEKH